jgi:hypothetical protein
VFYRLEKDTDVTRDVFLDIGCDPKEMIERTVSEGYSGYGFSKKQLLR